MDVVGVVLGVVDLDEGSPDPRGGSLVEAFLLRLKPEQVGREMDRIRNACQG